MLNCAEFAFRVRFQQVYFLKPESAVVDDASVPEMDGPSQVQWTQVGVLQLQLMFV